MAAHKKFRPAILRYLEANEGRHIYVEELADAIGATKDQTQGAMTNLRAAMPDFPVKVVVVGNVWKYDRSAPVAVATVKRIFEELATTKDGSILIQDQHGAVYRAVEM